MLLGHLLGQAGARALVTSKMVLESPVEWEPEWLAKAPFQGLIHAGKIFEQLLWTLEVKNDPPGLT